MRVNPWVPPTIAYVHYTEALSVRYTESHVPTTDDRRGQEREERYSRGGGESGYSVSRGRSMDNYGEDSGNGGLGDFIDS